MESKKEGVIQYRILDFTEYPGPRYIKQGEDSGESFYQKILKNLFEDVLSKSSVGNKFLLEIDLDNTAGYASSFLDEAFGNLTYDFTQGVVLNHLKVISDQEPDWLDVIFKESIPEWEEKRKKGIPRKSGKE